MTIIIITTIIIEATYFLAYRWPTSLFWAAQSRQQRHLNNQPRSLISLRSPPTPKPPSSLHPSKIRLLPTHPSSSRRTHTLNPKP